MKRYKKAYASGGGLPATSSLVGTGSAIASSLVDAFAPVNKYGRQSGLATGLKQAGSLAAAGSALGPWGAGAGAAIGLGMGLIGSIGAARQERAMDRFQSTEDELASVQAGQAQIAADPTLRYGRKGAQMFALGGMMDGPGPKPRPRPAANPFGPGPIMVEKANGTIGQWGNPIDTMSRVPAFPVTPPILPSEKARGLDNSYNPVRMQQQGTSPATLRRSPGYYAMGGQLQALNSAAVEVDGASHEQGGVQLPQAEVEGGETISNGFVFSDELGFAKQHKPIAKAIGKIEKKPMNNIRMKTLERLRGQEQKLALQQEYYKQQQGIPSELDGQQ